MPNWDEIRNEWETSEITFKDLAEKHDIKDSTIRSRKNREKWQRNDEPKKVQRVTQRKRNVATRKVEEEVFVESDDLTDKQRLFCIYYIKYFNATKAYQKAYKCDYMTAQSIAYRLMGNDGVIAEINRMKKQVADGLMIDASMILQKYIDIALADITDFVGFDSKEVVAKNEFGEVLTDGDGNEITYHLNDVNFRSSDEVDGTIITEVKQGKDGVSLKLADKMKAMEMLAKYTDLLSDGVKKRLQEEKLKADIAKAKADADKTNDDDKEIKIMITRAERPDVDD